MELIVVVTVLAILAAVAISKYIDYSDLARRSAAKAARAALVEAVTQHRLQSAINGSPNPWPATIDTVLQGTGGERSLNPYVDASQAVYNTDGANDPAKFHPTNKTIETAMAINVGAIWYNSLNGSVRFRVPDQASAPQTLVIYNDVNCCAVASLAQTSP